MNAFLSFPHTKLNSSVGGRRIWIGLLCYGSNAEKSLISDREVIRSFLRTALLYFFCFGGVYIGLESDVLASISTKQITCVISKGNKAPGYVASIICKSIEERNERHLLPGLLFTERSEKTSCCFIPPIGL